MRTTSAAAVLATVGGMCGAGIAAAACEPTIQAFPGSQGMDAHVFAFELFDFGDGPIPVVGGDFDEGGGLTLKGLAKFENNAFAKIASGVAGGVQNAYVNDLCVVGGRLGFGGRFSTPADNMAARRINGWDQIDAPYEVHVVAAHDGKIWGTWTLNGVRHWQTWDGTTLVVDAAPTIEGGKIETAREIDLGEGPTLVIGGSFASSEGVSVRGLAKLNAQGEWRTFLGGADGAVRDLMVRDEAGVRKLYVVGSFEAIGGVGGVFAGGVAVWDGEAWTALGQLREANGEPGHAYTLAFFDDGEGEALYIGGRFDSVSGVPAKNIARLRDGVWEAIGAGAGPSHPSDTVTSVNALLACDIEGERSLFIGGDFGLFDAQPSSNIARLFACASVGGCPGDTNGDGEVNFADLNVVLAAYSSVDGGPGYNAAADFDGDGDVDFADLNLVVSAFNKPC